MYKPSTLISPPQSSHVSRCPLLHAQVATASPTPLKHSPVLYYLPPSCSAQHHGLRSIRPLALSACPHRGLKEAAGPLSAGLAFTSTFPPPALVLVPCRPVEMRSKRRGAPLRGLGTWADWTFASPALVCVCVILGESHHAPGLVLQCASARPASSVAWPGLGEAPGSSCTARPTWPAMMRTMGLLHARIGLVPGVAMLLS